ncbi:MAG: alpha/beta hydrolase [bacterium]|nr:alpha/beta hydrolase [bacterium]
MTEALVLAHGAFHGPWCWDRTVARLQEQGIRCIAVDLNRGGLHADREALQGAVDAARDEGCRVHAIGHSLGCPPVALIDPKTIATAVLLAGPVEGPGMPGMADCTFEDFGSKLLPQEDGRAFMSRANARETFYHRCTDEEAEWALDRLRPTFVYGAEVADTPIWQAIPVTYIACTDDRAVRPDYQAAIARQIPFSTRIETDHSPMLGRSEELTEIIITAMGRAG